MPSDARPTGPGDSGRTVVTYLVLALLLALTWAGEFFAFVIVSFGYTSCRAADPSEVTQGRLILGVVAALAAIVWGGLWLLTGRRIGAALMALVAVAPAAGFFVYGLVDAGFWASGWCF